MKEDEKNPIPTNSKPSLPKIYENTILLKNRVEAKIIDCNLKSKYKNNVIIIETNIAEKEEKTLILNRSNKYVFISNSLKITFAIRTHEKEIKNCNSIQ